MYTTIIYWYETWKENNPLRRIYFENLKDEYIYWWR